MYKLATIFRGEGDFEQYSEWLERSATEKNFDAMKEFADLLREKGEHEKSFALYKELAETFGDEEAMENMVDMIERGQGTPESDKTALNFILQLIGKHYNEIYLIDRGNIIARTLKLQTCRHDELTMETWQAVERRRIAARIRKLLSED